MSTWRQALQRIALRMLGFLEAAASERAGQEAFVSGWVFGINFAAVPILYKKNTGTNSLLDTCHNENNEVSRARYVHQT